MVEAKDIIERPFMLFMDAGTTLLQIGMKAVITLVEWGCQQWKEIVDQ